MQYLDKKVLLNMNAFLRLIYFCGAVALVFGLVIFYVQEILRLYKSAESDEATAVVRQVTNPFTDPLR